MLRKISIALALLAESSMAANAAGDPKAGAQVFKECAQCHVAEKGGGNGLGPNLFGVVGRKAASLPDFQYSGALKASHITWNDAALMKWVAKPGAMVPGTKMTFAGLSSKSQQANVVAYLNTLK